MPLDCIDMDIGSVTILKLTGRLTLGQATQTFREAIDSLAERGRVLLLLDFDEVFYVDSSGLGELVAARKLVIDAGGAIKLMKLNLITRDLIQLTHLYMLFEVFKDEASALASFPGQPAPPEDTSTALPDA